MGEKQAVFSAAWRAAIGAPEAYASIIVALHAFAHATGGPAGTDVLTWFKAKSEQAEAAGRRALLQPTSQDAKEGS